MDRQYPEGFLDLITMKALFSLLLTGILVGCAEKVVWVHPSKGAEEMLKDKAECEIFAKLKSAELTPSPHSFAPPAGNQQTLIISPYGYYTQQSPDYFQMMIAQGTAYGVQRGMLEAELFRACMKLKGYRLEKVNK